MPKVILHIKTIAEKREILESLIPQEENLFGLNFSIDTEKSEQASLVSRVPIAGHEATQLNELLRLISAEAVVRIVAEKIVGDLAWKGFLFILKGLSIFVSKNNKRKRNFWGAKLELKRDLANKKVQTLHFFFDKILEENMDTAISKVHDKVKMLDALVGEQYLEEIKSVGFTYKQEVQEWEVLVVEKFDGNIKKSLN